MVEALEQARAAMDVQAWDVARTLLVAVDDQGGLAEPEDLQRLALSASLTGRDEVADAGWERAYGAFLDRGEVLPAVRCAFWLGLVLSAARGDEARGSGWFARAHRVLRERGPEDCAERGYLLLPVALRDLDGGDPHGALRAFSEAAAIGERFGDADLSTLGRLGQGQSLIRTGETASGLAHLDEAIVTVGAGRASPIAVGIVHCAAIIACQQVFDLRRAQEWTAALDDWCDAHPDLVPFRGQCLVHRSELAQWRGDWDQAVIEADLACRWLADASDPAAGMAHYQRAELHRMRGEHALAEASYEEALALGHDPHPGLALLWLAQGRTEAAAGAMRCAVEGTSPAHPGVVSELRAPRPRSLLLAAQVEVMLAAGDVAAARTACGDLDGDADVPRTGALRAISARARGMVELDEGRYASALRALTDARADWTHLQAPYELARTRVLLARALRALGDEGTASMEDAAARRVFEAVGAAPDLERLPAPPAGGPATQLTPRELDVIRLVAAGRTNREIAEQLVISDKTVARHLHNAFTKLDLPNRAAATAYAYEHHLVQGRMDRTV
ncbi:MULTISPECIES: LuxR C-terminal-related transcriptional regulator [unclassified Modestobacter]|uniref:LuxR C-terminal-related transcriptional regulator n=1 Tax=unclassified Modestobacter TaxID=2643866 RepID=UPI0022AA779A|nr:MULTISPECIES: LuxR C-terminal-related transcriptional regulator [unclassified Modestobacter]MCZ2826124.1 LuxR C-terminal-related transcriptional regulator [Modestobacter sp. VKM Ac-2981]MCZ2852811.1 LuxR C-terminal-related transcriptional regulator [Modestobacter sp. VKM Ac-2982]